ncbi:MAG: hypothetical protein H6669_13865 [Ardenticatenaceae bacterium]|nr:hypothetical protein [Ardenticatenaceae bacterium]
MTRPPTSKMITLLRQSVERGVTFDTAEVYGPFTNEPQGEAPGTVQGQAVIATNGWKHGENGPHPSVG